jgi:hypothetical protein
MARISVRYTIEPSHWLLFGIEQAEQAEQANINKLAVL